MKQIKDIEGLLSQFPVMQADAAFKQTLGRELSEKFSTGFVRKAQPSMWSWNAFFPRFAIVTALSLLVAVGVYYTQKSTGGNIFRPTKVMAAEIIRHSKETFFKPGTIYHHRVKQYVDGAGEPTVYELWADMDTQRFRNHVVYAPTSGGAEVWQWFNLDVQWDVDVTAKTARKDIYHYQNPQERTEKKGERVDLSQQFDKLISEGVLEAKEGKLDRRDVYVVYDTRTSPDKYWDMLTFDRQTFQLLRTETYTGEGENRRLQTLAEYELQESLPKTDELIKQYFSEPPVNLDGFTVTERVFDTSQGYLDDGIRVSPEKSKIVAADFTENCQILIKTTNNKDYTIHTGYEDAGAGRCYQYAQLRISPFGQYIAYEDISGGIDSKISLYVLLHDKSYGLGVYGTSNIFGIEFLPDDRLIVYNGFKDTQPPEQNLAILNIAEMVKELPADAEWYTNKKFDSYIKHLDLTGLDQVYEFLVITDKDVQIKDAQGKIGRSFPLSTL